jgi:hypothetical protein
MNQKWKNPFWTELVPYLDYSVLDQSGHTPLLGKKLVLKL